VILKKLENSLPVFSKNMKDLAKKSTKVASVIVVASLMSNSVSADWFKATAINSDYATPELQKHVNEQVNKVKGGLREIEIRVKLGCGLSKDYANGITNKVKIEIDEAQIKQGVVKDGFTLTEAGVYTYNRKNLNFSQEVDMATGNSKFLDSGVCGEEIKNPTVGDGKSKSSIVDYTEMESMLESNKKIIKSTMETKKTIKSAMEPKKIIKSTMEPKKRVMKKL
jgi:hypothetical protein